MRGERPRLAGVLLVLVWCVAVACAGCTAVPREYAVREGDILFQPLPHGPLVDAIEGVSLSVYSHCGIVERKNDAWYVLEAIGPVRETPLDDWIRRGRGSHFDAYRLNSALQPKIPENARQARWFGRGAG